MHAPSPAAPPTAVPPATPAPAPASPSPSPSRSPSGLAAADTVRAVIQSSYGSPDVLQLGRIARPRPGEHEVLVAVVAAGLDRGTWHLVTGRPYLIRLLGFGLRAPRRPVPGLDLAGTVVEVGPGVTRFRVGDEVFGVGQGSFAELAVAHEDKLALRPASLPLGDCAVLGVSALTAIQALTDHGQLAAGERVLVVGASGGVGSFAVQMARALGAHVTGVCCTDKVDLVRALGADEVIDYRQADFTALPAGAARYDLILDVGGNTPLRRLRRVLAPRGRLVFVGGEQGGDYTAGLERQLLAMLMAPLVKQRFVMMMAREHHDGLDRIAAMVEAGQVRPVIDRRAPLAEVATALRDLEAGRVRGKVVLAVA